MTEAASKAKKEEEEIEVKSEDESESEEEEESGTESESDESLEAQLSGGDPLKCRMYKKDYPNKGDLVIVEVKKIVEMGAYCSLLEYNKLEGMLLLSELQRRRIRSVKRVIKEGRQEIVQVLRVNKEKHFIDLSKKRVDAEDMPKVEERWNKSKASHSIMRQVCKLSELKYSMKELYKLFGFQAAKDYGHLYDAFKFAMNNWEAFIEKYPTVPEDVREFLIKNIEKRLKPQMVTVRAKVELTCFTFEGVGAIKRALKAGIASQADDEELNLKIKLVAPPLFTVSVSTYEPQKGIALVNQVVAVINDSIKESEGTLVIKQEPQIITMDQDAL